MTPPEVVALAAPEAGARLRELAAILVDAVEGGASVSFMLPFRHEEALAYWRGLLPAVAAGRTVLLAALIGGAAVGTVQLGLATPPNQPHRADVAKLLVHRRARRRGVGRALMARVEDEARRRGRTLLTLDTLTGGEAERLYLALGYVRAGVIPGYARLPTGPLGDTSIFYKHLGGLT
ncbi:MAG TPA: GNAT family N-acetyltransferase [Geminicoccaceae bacterium]|nr:GNAT family N-acetyltransferase [Geminicoccaceae bacterium]